MDETGFSIVTKPGKVVFPKGCKRIFQQITAERGEKTIVLATINAAGQEGPVLITFKGQRLIDDLRSPCLPNTMVCVSSSGWIESDIFAGLALFCAEHSASKVGAHTSGFTR